VIERGADARRKGLQLIQIIIARCRCAINQPSHSQQVTSDMTKPIPDKAEVALEYPDKLGGFNWSLQHRS
jgi:hypothetical protein